MFKEGQIWRDTYGDKTRRNTRTVKLVRQEEDGRWVVVSNADRTTRVSEKTLRSGYELQE